MNNQEIFGNYGFFRIEPKNEDGSLAVLKAPGNEDVEFWNFSIGRNVVVPLTSNTYLVNASTCISFEGRRHFGSCNIFVRLTEDGVSLNKVDYGNHMPGEAYDEEYNTSVMDMGRIEIETAPYKMTDDLLSQGFIIIRSGEDYVLYDYVNGQVVSDTYHNIDEVNGEIVTETCVYGTHDVFESGTGWSRYSYPTDILVGKLGKNGALVDGSAISQKWNVPVKLVDGTLAHDYYDTTHNLENEYPMLTFDYLKYLENKKNGGRK